QHMGVDADNGLPPRLLEDPLSWGSRACRLGDSQIANLAGRAGAGDESGRCIAAEIVHYQDLNVFHVMVQAQILHREIDSVEILVRGHTDRQINHEFTLCTAAPLSMPLCSP